MTSEDEAAHPALPATAAVVPDRTTAALVRSRVEERAQVGRAARHAVPRAAHAAWSPPAERGDPVVLLAAQNVERVPWLVPIRHGRMMASPLTFYRGAARIMAADLAATPSSGLLVQLCGDAHLSTSGRTRRRSGRWCSTSSTSTRRCPDRSRGT